MQLKTNNTAITVHIFSMEKKRIVFIMNPISGTVSKAGIPELIEKHLDHNKFEYEIQATEYAGHAAEIASGLKDNYDIIVAVGGDGTVNEVARSIVHSKAALAILPCGSGNGLARHLLLPMNIKKCIEMINVCEIHELDYGKIDGKPFFCTCGMGFDAQVSHSFAESGKRGPISYAEQMVKECAKYKAEKYIITDENSTTIQKAWLVSCANASQYGNNAYIAPQASMSDGLLDVIIMEPFNIIDAPEIGIDMFSKTLNKSSKVKTWKTKKLHVEREAPGYIHYDGDPVMAGKDIDIELIEKGIKVVVNPNGDKSLRQPNAVQSAAAYFFNELNLVKEKIFKSTQAESKE